MRGLTTLLLMGLLSASFLVADTPKKDASKADMKKLQGKWRVTKFIDHSEEPAPADEIKDFTLEFRGDRIILRRGKGDKGKEIKYVLNSSKQPKWIDWEMASSLGTVEGIYKLDGDELSLCMVGGSRNGKMASRPGEFKASKRHKYSLFVLKRGKD